MKAIRLFALTMICLLINSVASYAGNVPKIGVVDFQDILQNSNSGQEIQNQLKEKGEALKSELKQKQDELMQMQEEYKKQSLFLDNEEKVKKERELRASFNEFRILQNENNQEFNKLRTELIKDLNKIIVDFAQKTGKSQGYSLIIEKRSGNVLYAEDSLDITNQFIKEIDRKENSKKK